MKSLKTIVKHNGRIRKFGKWELELLPSGRVITTDDWRIDYIVLYGYTWASDTPEILPESIKNWLHDNNRQLAKIQAQYLGQIGGRYKEHIEGNTTKEAYWAGFELK